MRSIHLLNTIRFCLAILLSLHVIDAHGQATSVTFDWKTKTFTPAGPLPFDEPFTVQVQNLSDTVDSFQLIFKAGKRPPRSGLRPPVDTDYFNSLPTLAILDFTKNSLQSTLAYRLEPDKYYYIGIKVYNKKNLTAKQSADLKSSLENNNQFRSDVVKTILGQDYHALTANSINRVLQKNVSAINPGYQLDTNAISNKFSSIQQEVAQIFVSYKEGEQKIGNLFHNLDSLSRSQPAIMENIIKRDTGAFHDYLTSNKSDSQFSQFLTPPEDSIIKANPKDATYLKSTFEGYKSAVIASYSRTAANISAWIDTAIIKTTLENSYFIFGLATTIATDNTSTSPYLSQTFGYGYNPTTSIGLLYFTFTCFFRPVNQNVPFSELDKSDRWKVQFCVNAGLTLSDVTTNNHGTISGLGSIFGNKAGIIGIGYRPVPFAKIDLNSMFYYLNDPNPTISHKRFVCSPLIGISLNLNIIKILAGKPNSLTSLQKDMKQ